MNISSMALIGFGIAVFNALFTFPIIFNFFIFPKMEKKLGHKIELDCFLYQMNAFPWLAKRLMKYFDIAGYIVVASALGSVGKKILEYGNNDNFRSSSLCKIHYDIKLASKNEIIFSFLAYLNAFAFLGCAAIVSLYH